MITNPIYIVDDDPDDHEILNDILKELELTNEVHFFFNGEELLKKLKEDSTVPFLIMSDINLPKMTGLELRARIIKDAEIHHKTIPFIFWSTNASDAQVKQAYDVSAHGFFIKGNNYNEVRDSLRKIVDYWSESLAPD